MKSIIIKGVILALLLATPSASNGGLRDYFSKRDKCDTECGDYCGAQPCPTKCVPECKTVVVEKHCWQTECEQVCIPPVTLPCCKCLFKGKCNGGGCSECGDRGCCDSGCGSCGADCSQDCCRNSLLQRLFSKCAGCRTRCVTRLKKHEYECEETKVEWHCVPCGGCCDSGCCDTGACCEPECAAPACCAPGGCQ